MSAAPTAGLEELLRLQEGVAKLVLHDPAYAPIFERLEREIEVLRASDPIARARAVLAVQKAMA